VRRSKFADEQILAIVKEGEAGRKVADLCRARGITEQSYSRWKSKYDGLELSELQRLKQLEETIGNIRAVSRFAQRSFSDPAQPLPRNVERSRPMTLEDSIHSQRLRVLRDAERLGNVSNPLASRPGNSYNRPRCPMPMID
jgi:putative transposase